MKYTVFVLYQALPAWLTLSRPQREAFFARKASPIFARFEKEVNKLPVRGRRHGLESQLLDA